MLSYALRKIVWALFSLWFVSTLVFSLLYLIPGDPVDLILGETALEASRDQLRQQLGLDLPFHQRYFDYVQSLLSGDLGTSILSKKPVSDLILQHYPATIELMAGSMVVAVLIAFPLGIIAAIKRGSLLDQSIGVLVMLGVAIPNFFLGPVLIIIFSINLGWLPVNESGGFEHLVLPSITLGTAFASILCYMIRNNLADILTQEYILVARAKGLNFLQVVISHALPNAMIPVLTIIGLQIGVLLSGAIITERIFDWPGLGTLLINAIQQRDYTLVQGVILCIAGGYVVVNSVIDFLYTVVDPRIALAKS